MAKKKRDKYTPRKDGRYYTLVNTGKYDDGGKAIRIPLYASSSAELEDLVAETKYLLRTGNYKRPSSMTVAEYADRWFRTFKSQRGINTKAMYQNAIDKHITPAIGDIRVRDLTYTDCQLMINDRFSHYETCNKIQLTMRQIQMAALKDKVITEPFWEEIEMPKKPASRKRALTELEKTAIKAASLSTADKALLLFLFGCGLRREEVIALQAGDVDLDARTVHVSRKIVFDVNKPILEDGAKSEDGIRTIPIPKDILPEIRFHVRQRASLGSGTMLFTTQSGGLVSKSSYDRTWERILKRLNAAVATEENPEPIQGLTAHIFRHNYCTMLYYSGISELKAVQLMGHADGKMIREVYAHLDEQKENTVEKLDASIAL